MNYGMKFVTLYRRQGSRASPWKKKKRKKAKRLSEEALQTAEAEERPRGKKKIKRCKRDHKVQLEQAGGGYEKWLVPK